MLIIRVSCRGDEPDLTALALEWVRDREQTRHLDDVLRLLEHPDISEVQRDRFRLVVEARWS